MESGVLPWVLLHHGMHHSKLRRSVTERWCHVVLVLASHVSSSCKHSFLLRKKVGALGLCEASGLLSS